MKRSLIAALICFLCVVGLAQPVLAQTATTGQIVGVVKDQTGAVVPNATLSLTSAAGQQRTLSTDAEGRYRFALLPPGNYTLTVEAPGFKKLTLDYINVTVTQTTELDAGLTVAAAGESVNVTAEPPP